MDSRVISLTMEVEISDNYNYEILINYIKWLSLDGKLDVKSVTYGEDVTKKYEKHYSELLTLRR